MHIKQNKRGNINKKIFYSTLCNDMKIGQNVGTYSRWALEELSDGPIEQGSEYFLSISWRLISSLNLALKMVIV